MCGGVREFESMRTPEPLLHQKLHGEGRQWEGSACETMHAQDQDQLSRRRGTGPSKPSDGSGTAGTAAVPPLAGLAILAAMGGDPALPAHSSALPTPSARGPVTKLHLIAAQDKNGAPACQWRPSRAVAVSAGARPMAAPPARGRKRTDDRRSIFYCAVSPPKDLVAIATAPARPSADFLGACCLCRRRLGSGTDIFMYRGDRAFCSNDCRYQQMMEDERSDRVLLQQPKSLPARDCKHGRVGASASPMILPVLG